MLCEIVVYAVQCSRSIFRSSRVVSAKTFRRSRFQALRNGRKRRRETPSVDVPWNGEPIVSEKKKKKEKKRYNDNIMYARTYCKRVLYLLQLRVVYVWKFKSSSLDRRKSHGLCKIVREEKINQQTTRN